MRYRLILLLLLCAAAIAGWQAETRAALKQRLLLRALVAQLEPWGTLSYGQTRAHFWGSGQIQDLRFVPAPELKARRALPADFALFIPSLRYRDLQDGAGWPSAVHLSFDNALLPMPLPWPSEASGTFDWRYAGTDGSLQVAITLVAPGYATTEATLALRLADSNRFAGATLIGGSLRYHDLGLAQGERAALAIQGGADPQNAEVALTDALAQWLTEQGLPPDQELHSTLSTFAKEPLALTLHLDPPGALRPETLPLFTPADRIAALGLSATAE